MRVVYLPVAGNSVLNPIAAELRAVNLATAEAAVRVRGCLARDLTAGPPQVDRDLPESAVVAHLRVTHAALRDSVTTMACVRAAYYYPAGGGLGWHTNSQLPGWRVYVPLPLADTPISGTLTADGYFPDRVGFANAFLIDPAWQKSWHAVRAGTPRLSAGLWLPSDSPLMADWLAAAQDA